MKRCAACGTENDDWRPMCVKCGASYSGAAAEPVLGTPPPGMAPPLGPGALDARGKAPRPPRTGNSPKTVAIALVVTAAIVAAAVVGLTMVGSKDKAGAPTTTFPTNWDPRVSSLVQFDQKQRDLHYLHPVQVLFLSPAAFKKRLLGDQKLSAKDKREIQATLEALRAMGMVQGNVDLFKKLNQLTGETTEAFYDFEKKQVVVPEGAIDVAQKVTLAHELTHTLDDQHYDLDKVEKIGDKHDTDATEALIEGDAEAVENDYIAKLSPSDRRAYERSQDTAASGADLKGVPQVLGLLQEWAYDFGPVYVDLLRKVGGQAKVDAAFKNPPIDEEQVIDPLSYLDNDEPGAISAPKLPKGAKKLDSGKEFGVLMWYLMLSERIDPHVAMHAALGWGADSYAIAREGSQTCLEVHYRGETKRDNTQMLGALRQWIAALPHGMARVTANSDNTLSLRSCDPGSAAKTVTNRSLGAYQLLVFRTSLIGAAVQEGVAPAAATCLSDGVTDHTSVAEANSPNGPAFARNAAAMQSLAVSCRSTLSTIVPPDEIDNK
ncbi:MAG TPA: hypothetical protein VH914_01105 [Acidimicrobiia bacterium]|jgi:hypothetical protein|nr:hypothetical protein [Acidimicrobiia bacterium]